MNENDTTINSPAEPYDAGAEIVKMLIEHPERADELEEEDWQELDGDQWADLIEARPAFRSKGPWELSSWDWGRFFARPPDRLEAYPAFKESDEPSFWASFLAGQPQFAEKCPWDKLKGRDWAMLLCEQPQFADRCAWDKLEGYDWALLLEDQPQFADRCSWDKLDKCAWRRLLSAQPQFAEKCPLPEVFRQK